MDKVTIKTIVDKANADAKASHEYAVQQKLDNIKYHQQSIETARKAFEQRVADYAKEIAKYKGEIASLKGPAVVTAEDLFGAEVVAAAV